MKKTIILSFVILFTVQCSNSDIENDNSHLRTLNALIKSSLIKFDQQNALNPKKVEPFYFEAYKVDSISKIVLNSPRPFADSLILNEYINVLSKYQADNQILNFDLIDSKHIETIVLSNEYYSLETILGNIFKDDYKFDKVSPEVLLLENSNKRYSGVIRLIAYSTTEEPLIIIGKLKADTLAEIYDTLEIIDGGGIYESDKNDHIEGLIINYSEYSDEKFSVPFSFQFK